MFKFWLRCIVQSLLHVLTRRMNVADADVLVVVANGRQGQASTAKTTYAYRGQHWTSNPIPLTTLRKRYESLEKGDGYH